MQTRSHHSYTKWAGVDRVIRTDELIPEQTLARHYWLPIQSIALTWGVRRAFVLCIRGVFSYGEIQVSPGPQKCFRNSIAGDGVLELASIGQNKCARTTSTTSSANNNHWTAIIMRVLFRYSIGHFVGIVEFAVFHPIPIRYRYKLRFETKLYILRSTNLWLMDGQCTRDVSVTGA